MRVYINKTKNKVGDYQMSAAVEQLEESYEEAAEVDAEYEYLLKNKDKGITFEEYCRQRGIEL